MAPFLCGTTYRVRYKTPPSYLIPKKTHPCRHIPLYLIVITDIPRHQAELDIRLVGRLAKLYVRLGLLGIGVGLS